jgi:hypothetical protein
MDKYEISKYELYQMVDKYQRRKIRLLPILLFIDFVKGVFSNE